MSRVPAFRDHFDPRLELGQDRVSRGRAIGAHRRSGVRIEAALPALDIVERATRDDIVRRRLEDTLELGLRLLDTAELEE